MLVTPRDFQKYAIYISGRWKDSSANLHNTSIALTAFNRLWYIEYVYISKGTQGAHTSEDGAESKWEES